MNTKVKLKMGLSERPAIFVQQASEVCSKMVNNQTLFPAPTISLVTYKEKIGELSTAITNALEGGKQAIALRNQLMSEVRGMTIQLAGYVSSVADGNAVTILASGFQIRAQRTPSQMPAQVQNLKTVFISDAGNSELKWQAVGNADSYEVQVSTDNVVFMPKAVCTRARVRFTGLPSGRVYFRVAAIGAAGKGEWSQTAWALVA